jgi:hypothetical protein
MKEKRHNKINTQFTLKLFVIEYDDPYDKNGFHCVVFFILFVWYAEWKKKTNIYIFFISISSHFCSSQFKLPKTTFSVYDENFSSHPSYMIHFEFSQKRKKKISWNCKNIIKSRSLFVNHKIHIIFVIFMCNTAHQRTFLHKIFLSSWNSEEKRWNFYFFLENEFFKVRERWKP